MASPTASTPRNVGAKRRREGRLSGRAGDADAGSGSGSDVDIDNGRADYRKKASGPSVVEVAQQGEGVEAGGVPAFECDLQRVLAD